MAIILRSLNFTVYVCSLKDGNFRNEFFKRGFFVQTIDINKIDLDQIIENDHIDIVIANTIFCSPIVIKIQQKTKTILWIREGQNIIELLEKNNIEKDILEHIDKLVCVSEYAKRFICSNFHVKRIDVIHNFVVDEYRHKLNFTKNEIVNFAVIGTIEPRKMQAFVIKAFAMLPETIRDNVYLNIIGNLPVWAKTYWDELIHLNFKNIIFHGEISDKRRRKIYERMNAFIVASSDEACSLVALEGAMLGKAVIISDHVGAKYLFEDSKYIYRYDNLDELIWCMRQLTSRKELLKEGIKNRYKYLRYATERTYKKTMMLYLKNLISEQGEEYE